MRHTCPLCGEEYSDLAFHIIWECSRIDRSFNDGPGAEVVCICGNHYYFDVHEVNAGCYLSDSWLAKHFADHTFEEHVLAGLSDDVAPPMTYQYTGCGEWL